MEKLKNFLLRLLKIFPRIYSFISISQFTKTKSIYKFSNVLMQPADNLQKILNQYHKDGNTLSIDLGCSNSPKNPFNASEVFGIDLFEQKENNIYKCRLGFERIPFDENSFDFVSAFDLIEHIPRYSERDDIHNNPFIFLMNEIWRILKVEGIFLSHTPIYPFKSSFQDPTHNNIITADTFNLYFSENKYEIASQYGINCNFKISDQYLYGEHLVSILKK